jgi:hypothetical protein
LTIGFEEIAIISRVVASRAVKAMERRRAVLDASRELIEILVDMTPFRRLQAYRVIELPPSTAYSHPPTEVGGGGLRRHPPEVFTEVRARRCR